MVLKIRAKPKQRPRVTRFGTYTPKDTVEYERLIASLYRAHTKDVYTGAVEIFIEYHFKIPKARIKKLRKGEPHLQRPDEDNLTKAIKDALNGVAYADDELVWHTDSRKVWWDEDEIILEIKEG